MAGQVQTKLENMKGKPVKAVVPLSSDLVQGTFTTTDDKRRRRGPNDMRDMYVSSPLSHYGFNCHSLRDFL